MAAASARAAASTRVTGPSGRVSPPHPVATVAGAR
jgi:hypothetical protein